MALQQTKSPLFSELGVVDDDVRNKQIYLFNVNDELTGRIIMVPNKLNDAYEIKLNEIRPTSGNITTTKCLILYGRETIDNSEFTTLLTSAGLSGAEITTLLTL